MKRFIVLLLLIVGTSSTAFSAEFNGATAGLLWVVPFVGVILSIAILPMFLAKFWEHHYGKVILFWCIGFIVPFVISFGVGDTIHLVAHAMLLEFIPFIVLIFTLFTISGGIYLEGNLKGTPKLNAIILLVGTLLASFMGTTGAAMLLIRPLLRANKDRQSRVHIVIFFIFLVANVGGSLTPLGDPPLFLGFLKGVSFFWTMSNMFMPLAITTIIVLSIFYIMDCHYYKNERVTEDASIKEPLRVKGLVNFLLLLGVIGGVLLSGFWKSEIEFNVMGITVGLPNLARDVILLSMAAISLKLTPKEVHEKNGFGWEPIFEVGKIFAGIFLTIAPVLQILQAGSAGSMAGIVSLVNDSNGHPINSMYFWMSGVLSAFLDNAPTYLVFFNLASGDAQQLMGELSTTLLAIATGSVFMGAMTYIGNAPNFMVKSIAEQSGIKMPTFFGYMKWSVAILIPVYILLTFIFFI